MLSKYIAPVLAVAGGAYAQCSTSATATITDAAGATAVAGCTTYTGSIAISSNASGDINFGGITSITGDLTGLNTGNVTSVTATSLQTINGALSFSGMVSSNLLSFPALTRVGTLSLSNLGQKLQTLTFDAGLNNVGALTIADTYIGDLKGLAPTSASAVTITNNRYLSSITFPLKSVTGKITISGFGSGAGNVVMSSLATAGTLDVSNVNNVSFPSLDNVTNYVSFTENHFTLLALPNLTTSNQLTISNNAEMTNFTVPSYISTSAGGLDVEGNDALTGTVSFPVLALVGGAITISGSFSDIYMPALQSVLGGANITSTSDISDTCSHFDSIHGSSNIIQGVETCSSSAATTTSGTPSGSAAATGATSTASHTGAASLSYGPYEASTYTVFGLLAAVFGMLM